MSSLKSASEKPSVWRTMKPSHFTLPLYRGVRLSGRGRGWLGIGPKCILHWAFLARFVVFKDHNRSPLMCTLILQRGGTVCPSLQVSLMSSLVDSCFSEDSVCQVKASLRFTQRLFRERQLLLIKKMFALTTTNKTSIISTVNKQRFLWLWQSKPLRTGQITCDSDQ